MLGISGLWYFVVSCKLVAVCCGLYVDGCGFYVAGSFVGC